MRMLMVAAPMLGHVIPMVPLAWALRRLGHEVLVATAADGLAVRSAGLPVTDVAPGFTFGRVARRFMLRHPLVARATLAGHGGMRGVRLLFGAVNTAMADGVLRVTRSWAPHLVVHEPLAAVAAVAAMRHRVPAVVHDCYFFEGMDLVHSTVAGLRGPVRDAAATPTPLARVRLAPPSVAPSRDAWPLRFVPYAGAGSAPAWLTEPGSRRRILVTRSTVAGPGAAALMTAVVAAAPRVDAEIVLVHPDRRLARRRLPDNVRVVPWVPHDRVLNGCDALVHHGGAGSMFQAFAAGLPQLTVPGVGDRTHNGRLLAASGAGLTRPLREVTAAVLTRLLEDDGLRARAGDLRHEIAAMPTPDEQAARLVARL